MTYVIERASIKKEYGIEHCSLLIKGNRIDYISANMENMKLMKMDVGSYLLTPGHVILDFTLEKVTTFPTFMERMKRHISEGCTTILVCATVQSDTELIPLYRKLQHLMINSPIDYCIGVRIPFSLLTPPFIRQCKRLKIPVLFLDVVEGEMEKIAWAWIREALYPYYLALVPIWCKEYSNGKIKKLTEAWKELLKNEAIPTIPSCPKENTPLQQNILRKIGISPIKGEIRIGGEVDYNLYKRKSVEFANREEINYDMDKAIITVHNGRCIMAGGNYYINPGFGRQISIKVPGYFASTF